MSVNLQLAAQKIEQFRSDTAGNVAIVFALMSVVLMLAIGAAVDMGRWLHARDKTIAAVDAAVLAGGRALQTDGSNEEGAIAAAAKYYDENVTTRLPVVNDTVSFTVADDGMGIVANGSAFIKTPFLRFANIEKLPLISKRQNPVARSQIAVGGNGGENIEVSVMLDVTGSMAGQKLQDLKDAASDLVNIVVWDDQSKFTLEGSFGAILRGHPPADHLGVDQGKGPQRARQQVNRQWQQQEDLLSGGLRCGAHRNRQVQ